MRVTSLFPAVGVLCLSAMALPSQAALFDCSSEPGYCVGEGDTVIFKYVGSSSSMGLFGNLEVIGDQIVAFPTDFRAQSSEGVGQHSGLATDTVTDNGAIQVIAKSGYKLDSVNVLERGDYLMTNTGSTSVTADAWLDVWDWNDLFAPSVQTTLDVTGDGVVGGVFTTRDGVKHTWQAEGGFDLTGSTWDGVNHIGLQLQNDLTAHSLDEIAGTDLAWIEKKLVGGAVGVSIETSVVPVPAAVWLFGSGLLGLVGVARRKK